MTMSTPLDIRNKLKHVAVVRCAMVTLLLGSALAFNPDAVASLADPVYRSLLFWIVATYAFTLVAALFLRLNFAMPFLAHAGFAFDAATAAALVLLTGHTESPYTYLFVIVALYGGVIGGRPYGLTAAVYATASLLFLFLMARQVPWLEPFTADDPLQARVVRALGLFAATAGVGLLSGLLAERLTRVSESFAVTHRSMAALQNLHEHIVESLSSGLITIDRDDTIVYANAAAHHILGLTPPLAGQPFADTGLTLPMLPQEGQHTWELPLRLANGKTLLLEVSLAQLQTPGSQAEAQILLFDDVTEHRRMRRTLQQRERLATLGRFAASIAHEIRNPLASISGSVEMLAVDLDARGDNATLLRIILTEIERLNTLVRNVLTYANPKNVQRVCTSVDGIVEDAACLFRNDPLAASLDFNVTFVQRPMVFVDPASLHQVLLNLWRNAAEAAGPQGSVWTHIEEDAESVRLLVADSGPGFSPEDRERLFEPFFTTKRDGNGLGLATAFHIIAENHGALRVLQEAPGLAVEASGAVFEIRLPRTESGLFPKVNPPSPLTPEVTA